MERARRGGGRKSTAYYIQVRPTVVSDEIGHGELVAAVDRSMERGAKQDVQSAAMLGAGACMLRPANHSSSSTLALLRTFYILPSVVRTSVQGTALAFQKIIKAARWIDRDETQVSPPLAY